MSGGVDSSVVAGELKKTGYQVTGVFLRFWKEKENKIDDQKEIQEVQEICNVLAIPLKIIDVREKFKREVVGYFLKEYAQGKTPNPCIFCNENIKFKILLAEMLSMDVDYIATGHYAKIIKKSGKYVLAMAEDKKKDQSYFLYRLKEKQLSKIMFPLGQYKKNVVRKKAQEFKLMVANKKESQDICFLNQSCTKQFLKKNISLKKGPIVDIQGKIIGQHEGLSLYTLGQRKNINIGGDGPYYVIAKKYTENKLVVTNQSQELKLFTKRICLEKVNWLGATPKLPLNCFIMIRYQAPLKCAIIDKTDNNNSSMELEAIFRRQQKIPAPGQSAVFYNKKEIVLGGGIIK